MVWALLAAFLRNRPPWAQAVMFGMCTGLFVAASAVGVQRIAHIGSATILVLVVAAFTGGAFYFALRAHLRSRSTARESGVWVHVVYAAVWLFAFVCGGARAPRSRRLEGGRPRHRAHRAVGTSGARRTPGAHRSSRPARHVVVPLVAHCPEDPASTADPHRDRTRTSGGRAPCSTSAGVAGR
jgi:hypothetical protein